MLTVDTFVKVQILPSVLVPPTGEHVHHGCGAKVDGPHAHFGRVHLAQIGHGGAGAVKEGLEALAAELDVVAGGQHVEAGFADAVGHNGHVVAQASGDEAGPDGAAARGDVDDARGAGGLAQQGSEKLGDDGWGDGVDVEDLGELLVEASLLRDPDAGIVDECVKSTFSQQCQLLCGNRGERKGGGGGGGDILPSVGAFDLLNGRGDGRLIDDVDQQRLDGTGKPHGPQFLSRLFALFLGAAAEEDVVGLGGDQLPGQLEADAAVG